ncbi:MAG TPA: PAS domain-containing protein, partial [Bacteroidia bacterium]|nr:PAS domain-containing protein [Bacteroidia bacterium]
MGSSFKSPSSTVGSDELLSGGGEMGELIRSYNWAATPLGPIDSWPQSLLTTISIILGSQYPMILWWGSDLIQFYNDAYRPSLGMEGKHPKALGQKAPECWAEIWSIVKPSVDQVLNGEPSIWSEDQIIPIYRNGVMEDVYWTFSSSAVKIEDGSIGGVLTVCIETTNKVVTLKKLLESEDQLRFAIEATELGTFDYDPIADAFKSNNRLKDWYGLPANAEIPLALTIESVAEHDKQRVKNAIQTALQYTYGGFYNIEYVIIHPVSRKERIVKAKGKVWFNSEKVAYRFNGTVQDITEQFAAINKMQDAEVLSRSTAERLHLALDAGKLGSYELILASGEIHCTPQCKINFGVPENETLTLEKLNAIILPEDKERVKQTRNEAIAERKIYNVEYRIQASTGEIRWVKVSGKPIYDEMDTPVKIIGVTVDISEQRFFTDSLSKQVKERTLQLERSNEDLMQFAHVTSHDLKEPARKVQTYVDKLVAEFGKTIPTKGATYLHKIQDATKRMFSMIDGVLHYSSINSEEHTIEQIDLNEIINNIESDIELLISEKKGVIQRDKLPVIEGANILVYQLFFNILSNSFKFSKKELNSVVSISSSIEKKDNLEFVKIIIKDNGVGFNKKQSDKLFNPFSRLHPKEKYQGTGLGLALCKKIV